VQDKIKHIIDSCFENLVSWREHIHANPELSFQEYKTSEFVASKLDEMNIPYQQGIVGTGIVALIKGRNPDKQCIALRADLDALPIIEENEVPYKSKIEGVMHACGHDVHTTCLLGAAIALHELRGEFEGTVKFIFQPGEELLPGGASLLIEAGVLENPKVDKIIALHVYPAMEVGKVGFKEGQYMASCDELYLNVEGKGGHAALPDQYHNPILLIAELLPALQNYVESLAGDEKFVFAFGKLYADGATNIIPATAHAEGTLRTMNEKWRLSVHQKIVAFVDSFLEENNAKGALEVRKGYPFLNNDESLTRTCKNAAQNYLGTSNVEDMGIRMTAEDFAYYSQEVPACFFRLGVRNQEKGIVYGVHTAQFDIDKQALKYGAGLMAYLALEALD